MRFAEKLKSLPDQPSCFTDWDLKLRPGFGDQFGDFTEYQEIVSALQ